MTLRAAAVSGVVRSGVATAIVTTLHVVQLIVVGRALSDHELGLYAIVLLVSAVIQIAADAGVSAFVVHRRQLSRDGISTLLRGNLLVSVATLTSVWVVAPWVAYFAKSPELVELLRAVALTALLLGCGKVFEALLQKQMRFGLLGVVQVSAGVCGATATIWLAVSGWGAGAPVAGMLLTAAIQNSALLAIGIREHRPRLFGPRVPLGRPWRFGLYQIGERAVSLCAERVDQVLLLGLLGTQAVGVYNLLHTVVSLPIQRLNPILTRVALPVFARVQDNRDDLRRGYLVLVNLVVTIDAALLAGLAAVAPLALPLLFGPERGTHSVLLQVLCFVALQRAIGNPAGSLILATGRARVSFLWNLLRCALSLPAVWVGAHAGGAVGVAIALGILGLVLKLPAYWLVIRPVLGPCGHEYLDAVLRPIALAMMMALGVATAGLACGTGWPSLIALVAGGAGLYAGLMFFGNRAVLRSALRSAG